jgi:hypothetical protein
MGDLAALLPGGPGWSDVQRSLRHDPEGVFRLLYYGLAPAQLVAPDSAETPLITVLIPMHNHWAITLNSLRSLVAMANGGPPLALLLQPTAEAITTCRQQGYGVLALGESPQVLLVGSLEGAAGELVQRLQQARPEWALVEKPTELLQKPEAMRLRALPGWDRQELRILASSTGLHTDGWLETPSRLVIQLLG